MRNVIYIFLIIGVLQACTDNTVTFSKYQSISNTKWNMDNEVSITIPIQDTLSFHNLYINLRNNKNYPYSNLYLITQMSFPDNTIVIDTLEYEMTDTEGRFLGSGFSDIKENKLFYKENVRFKYTGDYHFRVRHAMREREQIEGVKLLDGVTDIGISVEKIKK